MIIDAVPTRKVIPGQPVSDILDEYVRVLQEKDILTVTSKIVSICEGRVIPNDGKVNKRDLIRSEADLYLEDPGYYDRFHITLTIKNRILIASSGIDESNGNGNYILWPENPMESARKIWSYLRHKFGLKNLGVIITDSHTTPLRWGVTGIGMAWCGFMPLNRYIGKPDLFGRKFRFVYASVLDGLAAAAVTVMGEGAEQTPIARISGAYQVTFRTRPPTQKEIDSLKINLKDDIFAPLLTRAPWIDGGRTKKL